ncbi:MAG: winged helix-turn-helix transcriptional regulator [Paraclostridium sp.]|uniref:winged helix-turn-helix transcriptional regulator n=1 Tax=Paraclostridium sp. TaxID=2023273 RepID=UPI003F2A8774
MQRYGNETYQDCPFAKVQKIVSGKWNMLIIYLLSNEILRFGELHRKLPDMTQATLSKQLKSLEEYGVISRKSYNQIPPKVEYSLTEIGVKFLPVLTALETWSIEYEKYQDEKFNE